MTIDQLMEMQMDAEERLMKSRSADGMWRGSLSSSAISTAVSVFALWRIDAHEYATHIQAGVRWLHETMSSPMFHFMLWEKHPHNPAGTFISNLAVTQRKHSLWVCSVTMVATSPFPCPFS